MARKETPGRWKTDTLHGRFKRKESDYTDLALKEIRVAAEMTTTKGTK